MKYNLFFIKYSISLILLLLILSCSRDEKLSHIKDLYNSRDISFPKETELCIVLPEVGCGGCISGGVYYINDNKNFFSPKQNRNLIVFTAINSPKMLKRNMGVESLDEFNCIIDSIDLYLPDNENRIYPLILQLNNGKIISADYQSPESEKDIFKEINLE